MMHASRRENLRAYYANAYPFDQLFQMLSRGGGGEAFRKREIAFTVEDAQGEQRMWRFLSFSSAAEWKAKALEAVPLRMEVGGAYVNEPASRSPIAGRELVFDIDLPDYGDVRLCSCGSEKRACEDCWKTFACTAVHVLDDILRSRMGYRDIHWVFSGMKGVHAWVLDEQAFRLTEEQRRELVASLAQPRRDPTPEMARTRAILQLYSKHMSNVFRERLLPHIDYEDPRFSKLPRATMNVESLVLLWPRIDENVTKSLSHLIKLPYCVHPSTGNIASGFKASECNVFYPAEIMQMTTLDADAYQKNVDSFFQS